MTLMVASEARPLGLRFTRCPAAQRARKDFIRTSHACGSVDSLMDAINKKVVIVDDDPSVQEVTRAYLERDGTK